MWSRSRAVVWCFRTTHRSERFCERVGYRGFANFDVKYDERDGVYKFFEVNVRPGANTWYMTLGGVNFVKLIVDDYVLGCELPYREAYRDALYTLVPARVVRDFVADDELRDRALALFILAKYVEVEFLIDAL